MNGDGDVRVFVSSPNDVAPERSRAQAVAAKLNWDYHALMRFEVVLWEEQFYTADRTFQAQIPESMACDIVVTIFWTRIGTELPVDFRQLPDGKPYPSGTAYELLTALEASKQNGVPDVYVFRKTADALLPMADVLRRRLAQAQLDALEAFWTEWFKAESGEFKAAFQTFATTDEFEAQLESLLRQWVEGRGLPGRRVAWPPEKGSPFRGLAPFEAEHARVFFGRDRVTDEARRRLVTAAERGTPFLLIVGASGAGKSSLARAGLIPRLTTPGVVDGVDFWRVARLKPDDGEGGPRLALAMALFAAGALPELAQGDARTEAELAEVFRLGGKPVVRPVLRSLERAVEAEQRAGKPARGALLLLVDQLEQLFASDETDSETAAFAECLVELIATGQVWCVATLRADFYEQFLRQSALKNLKDVGAALDVGRMGAAELADVVRAPADAAGLEFERRVEQRLDDVLLAEAGENADALPLLSFTLQWLYDHRVGDRLTFAAYDQLGGLEGAIGRRAEQAFVALSREAKEMLPKLLRGLAETSSRQGKLVLRSMPMSKLPEGIQVRALVDALISARILFVDQESHGLTLHLAHEAVLRGWARARAIIDREQEFYRIRDEVETAERRWRGQPRDDLLVPEGLQLQEAKSLQDSYGAELNDDLLAFIAESIRYHEAENELRHRQEVEALQREKARLQEIAATQVNLLAQLAEAELLRGNKETALQVAVHSLQREIELQQSMSKLPQAAATLISIATRISWRLLMSGHSDVVSTAVFSGDGRILTASYDRTARIWDAETGRQIAVLSAHDKAVLSAAWSPDRTCIVTASADDTARIWDVATASPIAILRGHGGSPWYAKFSRDGARIATSDNDGTVRIWDAVSAAVVAACIGHEGQVYSVDWNPDGSRIVTASWDQTIRIWEAASARQTAVMRGHEGWVRSAAFDALGSRIVSASVDHTVRIWDASSAQQIGILRGHEGWVNTAVFDLDGSHVITASDDKTTRVWNITSAQSILVLRGHEGPVKSAACSPDGRQIVTASADGTARLWDATVDRTIACLRGHDSKIHCAAFSPDGQRIVTASEDKTARIWDLAGREATTLRGHNSDVRTAAFRPDGLQIVTAAWDNTIRIWDTTTGKELVAIGGKKEYEAVAVQMANLRRHEDYVDPDYMYNCAGFSPDGSLIVGALGDKTARVWDAGTGHPVAVLRGHEGAVWSAAFSPDGSHIITAGDQTARIWDVASATTVRALTGHTQTVRTAVFSPDGLRVVTASDDHTARIWDAGSGVEIFALRRTDNGVSSARFSDDGRYVVTTIGAAAYIWHASTGLLVDVLSGHESWVSYAAVSHDGSRILTGSWDSTARLWDNTLVNMSVTALLREICMRRLRGRTKLSREEMRRAGYSDTVPEIDVCAGLG